MNTSPARATDHVLATRRPTDVRARRLSAALEGLARDLAESRRQVAQLRRDRQRLQDELRQVLNNRQATAASEDLTRVTEGETRGQG